MIPKEFEGREELYKELQKTLQGEVVAHVYSRNIQKANLPRRGTLPITLKPEHKDLESFKIINEYKNDISNQIKLGKGLYINGPVGNGKSSWAYKIAQQYIYNDALKGDIRTFPVYFISVPALMAKIKEGFDDSQLKKELAHSLTNADLVIFDDIGAENQTAYSREQIFLYINERYSQGKATLFTSNLPLDKLEMRIADRIKEMTTVVTLMGQSAR